MLVGCQNPNVITEVYEGLAEQLDITNLGAVKHFLGYDVRCDKGIYSIQLTSYIEAILKHFGLEDCKPVKAPMEPDYMKADNLGKPFDNTTQYRSLGRRVSAPTEMDWNAARRVVKYLKGTKEMQLVFGPGNG
ncbi:uncharacterized protein LOC131434032 [Malaya genurostris]|uniref:uncharacterized protein LOC131434032 n=1 Tax=Malaya genurostris TaxID=325434 RepID=UPI0026F3A9A2|nr:uncharacterized protein LOC131434032 [Malaya genurostris]